ncbi:21542_t:CDS:10 [Gigaspora margarita]|uniref:21542_t:CDS:1 n=1 Tax=Gigaspora margarita TaxID=4874 RepID=A0ABN7UJT4_GIGMA|nr:21542_t:CDS:10 [Gigaspora margarita]
MVFGKSNPPPRPNIEIPEANANIFSIITFWWANNLMSLGYKRPLEKEDLYVLNDARTAKFLTDKFDIEWKNETQKIALGKKPSLAKALYRVLGVKFFIAGVYRLIGDTLQVTSPLVLKLILNYVTEAYYPNLNNGVQPPDYIGYVLIVALFLMQMGVTIFTNLYFYFGMETGILVRSILITTIYRKALVLSGKARSLFTNGKITNLMSTDTTRIDFVCGYFHIMWAAPVQICIALGLLIVNLGPSALAGFALLVLVGPMQGKVMSLMARTRSKAAGVTDERVKLTQEILLGIRVIKYYAWEDSFADALQKLRNREVSLVRLLLIIRAGISGVSMVIPVFASILAFVTYALTGGTLTAGVVFSSLALFNILRLPLMFIPMVLAAVTDAYVSINRINEFLQSDELSVLPRINPDEQYAVKVTDGEFIWESAPPEEIANKSKKKKKKEKKSKNHKKNNNNENDSSNVIANEKAPEDISNTSTSSTSDDLANSKAQLRNINVLIPHGKLIAVVGSVGSGKSSLLSALVGEMKRIKGEVLFGGNVGYCPQTAWIQNATLRDNITFGLPYNEEKYRQVIKDCCLEPDLKVLPAGDLTEIGEKGINLSGGQKQRVNIARAVYYNADIVLLDDPLSAVDAHIGIYCAWGVAQGIFSVLGGVVFSYAGVGAAKNLHNNAIKRVLRAPTSFFDTTPLGRIINRKDVDTCDSLLSESYRMFTMTFASVFGIFILIVVVFVWFIIPLVPLIVLYYFAALYYRSTNRELKRLDSVLRSSLYAHFSETLTGLPTIRAYREQERFLRFSVVPSITGLVLSYALQVTGTFNWCVRQVAEVEANMNSVERLVHYSNNLEVEAENIIPDNRPPPGWPSRGEIHIKNLEIKYGPDSPLVLKGISIDFMAAEKIGIVGRTGCGKSTLATSFFRFIEATSGSIVIDDIDISTIGLRDLRRNVTIIPQDPVLFNGTIRSNLDPFNEHNDLDLWNALRRVHLIKTSEKEESEKSEIVLSNSDQKNNKQEPLMLDSPVKENGSNFSQGQQQLIAMARALVRHSKLIIMDEATASIDFRTDHLIQTTIRNEFKDSTVITIAHRLRTVADYDRILVMDAGEVAEFDAPYLLMQKPDGVFRGMCERSGELAELMEIAKQKYEKNKSHPQLGESFSIQEKFFEAIRQYGLSQGFTIRYGKVDNRNKEKNIYKKTILCSYEGIPVAKKKDDKPK